MRLSNAFDDDAEAGPSIFDLEFANRVRTERGRHFIGENIKFQDKKGRVIGLFPHFMLLMGKHYNWCVSYVDYILYGGKKKEDGRRKIYYEEIH